MESPRISHHAFRLFRDLWHIIMPHYCMICGRRLTVREEAVCSTCFMTLPRTQICGRAGNGLERLFWGRIPIERASAYMYYIPQSQSHEVFIRLKYKHRPQIGPFFGRVMAQELLCTGFFDGIDMIIPVPLSKQRRRKRGYNQSAQIARGIRQITGIPIREDIVARSLDNPSQTRLSTTDRRANVQGIFTLLSARELAGRHVLLVDDILTTGSTVLSCAQCLAKAGDVRISVLTMGMARHYHVAKAVADIAKNTGYDLDADNEDEVWYYPAPKN